MVSDHVPLIQDFSTLLLFDDCQHQFFDVEMVLAVAGCLPASVASTH